MLNNTNVEDSCQFLFKLNLFRIDKDDKDDKDESETSLGSQKFWVFLPFFS